MACMHTHAHTHTYLHFVQGPMGLCQAVQEGNLDKVSRLLSTKRESLGGQDRIFDQRNEQGHAPLHIACVRGYTLVTKQC